MIRRASILLLSLAAFVSAACQESGNLTLDEALRLGRERSHPLRASQARTEGALARADEARSALLPSLKVDASYRRLSDVPPFSVALPFPGFTPIVISPMIPDNYQLHASVQQPLFTGSRLTNLARAARLQAEASGQDTRNDESDLVLSVTNAYWALYQARELKGAAEENVSRLENFERDTKNLLDAGMATRNDLLRIQVQLQSGRLALIDAANDFQIAGMNLNTLIGRPVDAPVTPASQPDTSVREPAAPPSVERALGERPDVAAMQARVEASQASLDAARGSYFPQIVLSANYTYAKPNQRYLPALNQWKDTWDLGVLVQLDVWNWGATSSQTEQAGAALRANMEMLEQARQAASLDVQRSDLALRRSASRISVARLGVSQAEENVRIISEKYRAGLATSSELLDASVALLQAKTSYTGALAEEETARARLARALGTLH
jgi:outer membrane protein TolC